MKLISLRQSRVFTLRKKQQYPSSNSKQIKSCKHVEWDVLMNEY